MAKIVTDDYETQGRTRAVKRHMLFTCGITLIFGALCDNTAELILAYLGVLLVAYAVEPFFTSK